MFNSSIECLCNYNWGIDVCIVQAFGSVDEMNPFKAFAPRSKCFFSPSTPAIPKMAGASWTSTSPGFKFSLCSFPFGLSFPKLSHPNPYFPLANIVSPVFKTGTYPHGQVLSVSTPAQARDAGRVFLILPYPPLVQTVPQRYEPISPTGRECAVDRVERERIDGVDNVGVGFVRERGRLPVALERVLAGLRRGGGIEEFDGDAAFDARRGVSGIVGHAGDGSGHEFQRALPALPGLEL